MLEVIEVDLPKIQLKMCTCMSNKNLKLETKISPQKYTTDDHQG